MSVKDVLVYGVGAGEFTAWTAQYMDQQGKWHPVGDKWPHGHRQDAVLAMIAHRMECEALAHSVDGATGSAMPDALPLRYRLTRHSITSAVDGEEIPFDG